MITLRSSIIVVVAVVDLVVAETNCVCNYLLCGAVICTRTVWFSLELQSVHETPISSVVAGCSVLQSHHTSLRPVMKLILFLSCQITTPGELILRGTNSYSESLTRLSCIVMV